MFTVRYFKIHHGRWCTVPIVSQPGNARAVGQHNGRPGAEGGRWVPFCSSHPTRNFHRTPPAGGYALTAYNPPQSPPQQYSTNPLKANDLPTVNRCVFRGRREIKVTGVGRSVQSILFSRHRAWTAYL